jgi:hypothetical protein
MIRAEWHIARSSFLHLLCKLDKLGIHGLLGLLRFPSNYWMSLKNAGAMIYFQCTVKVVQLMQGQLDKPSSFRDCRGLPFCRLSNFAALFYPAFGHGDKFEQALLVLRLYV